MFGNKISKNTLDGGSKYQKCSNLATIFFALLKRRQKDAKKNYF